MAIASTPVSATHPLANAASTSSAPTDAVSSTWLGGGSGANGSPRSRPMTTTAPTSSTNTTAGNANSRPPVSTPHRFTAVTTTRASRQSSTVHGNSAGNAEVSAYMLG